jgi:hypothetical protein
MIGRNETTGLWDFVNNAGKALGIGEAEAAGAPPPEALQKEVEELGLKTEGLKIAVEGDTVKLTGRAASQAEKEKVILAVGNVAGVAKVEEEIETPEPASQPVFHTVVKGDTLWKIAEKSLDSGSRYKELLRSQLSDAQRPGQNLSGAGTTHSHKVVRARGKGWCADQVGDQQQRGFAIRRILIRRWGTSGQAE